MTTLRTSTTTTTTGASELPHLDLRRPAWMAAALCADAVVLAAVGGCMIDAELAKATCDVALDVCHRCSVEASCLAWTARHRRSDGDRRRHHRHRAQGDAEGHDVIGTFSLRVMHSPCRL